MFLGKSWIEIPDWCGKCSYKRNYVYFLEQHNLNSFGYLLCEWLFICLPLSVPSSSRYSDMTLLQKTEATSGFHKHFLLHCQLIILFHLFFRLKEYKRSWWNNGFDLICLQEKYTSGFHKHFLLHCQLIILFHLFFRLKEYKRSSHWMK